jgi:hypothetical protein
MEVYIILSPISQEESPNITVLPRTGAYKDCTACLHLDSSRVHFSTSAVDKNSTLACGEVHCHTCLQL